MFYIVEYYRGYNLISLLVRNRCKKEHVSNITIIFETKEREENNLCLKVMKQN